MFGLEEIMKTKLADDDVNSVDVHGNTPLAFASAYGKDAIVHLLLENGVDIDPRNNYQLTPLALAVVNGREGVVQALVDAGADIETRGSYGHTPLHRTGRRTSTHIARILIENGADTEAENDNRRTPLAYAVINNQLDMAQLLLEKGAMIESIHFNGGPQRELDWHGISDELVNLLLAHGADIDSKDDMGRSLLFEAAQHGNTSQLEMFLSRQPSPSSVDSRDCYGSTPLSMAACHGPGKAVELLLRHESVQIDSKDDFGRTPLWWTLRNANTQLEELLRGAAARTGLTLRGVDCLPKLRAFILVTREILMYASNVSTMGLGVLILLMF
ncbi:Uu.00g051130.m01.CDS01 [Anthostomella pinea]|uniref:Uu.00g051130.m01.CDS01 n=1 Tax=Anthostomella pinea TaxID=933095 RepID=A0AAI8VSS8_9PEZI|nr:Uu.00g051130.m01.CDS01 [Anthostomella pinea]